MTPRGLRYSERSLWERAEIDGDQEVLDVLERLDRMRQSSDPRDLTGDIAGPGGPYDEGQVVIDTTNAVLMDSLDVARVDNRSDGRSMVALLIGGRLNRSEDRARVLFLGDLDMLAALITEAHGLAKRMGRHRELLRLCDARWEEQP
jgi:hypothetical protein